MKKIINIFLAILLLLLFFPKNSSSETFTFIKPPEPVYDEETGCNKTSDDYELCRQSFYMKKQNDLMLGNFNDKKVVNENSELEAITNLSDDNIKLNKEILELKSKNENLLLLLNQNECNLNNKIYIIDELFNLKNLIILLIIIILLLIYLLIKKNVFKK